MHAWRVQYGGNARVVSPQWLGGSLDQVEADGQGDRLGAATDTELRAREPHVVFDCSCRQAEGLSDFGGRLARCNPL